MNDSFDDSFKSKLQSMSWTERLLWGSSVSFCVAIVVGPLAGVFYLFLRALILISNH